MPMHSSLDTYSKGLMHDLVTPLMYITGLHRMLNLIWSNNAYSKSFHKPPWTGRPLHNPLEYTESPGSRRTLPPGYYADAGPTSAQQQLEVTLGSGSGSGRTASGNEDDIMLTWSAGDEIHGPAPAVLAMMDPQPAEPSAPAIPTILPPRSPSPSYRPPRWVNTTLSLLSGVYLILDAVLAFYADTMRHSARRRRSGTPFRPLRIMRWCWSRRRMHRTHARRTTSR